MANIWEQQLASSLAAGLPWLVASVLECRTRTLQLALSLGLSCKVCNTPRAGPCHDEACQCNALPSWIAWRSCHPSAHRRGGSSMYEKTLLCLQLSTLHLHLPSATIDGICSCHIEWRSNGLTGREGKRNGKRVVRLIMQESKVWIVISVITYQIQCLNDSLIWMAFQTMTGPSATHWFDSYP